MSLFSHCSHMLHVHCKIECWEVHVSFPNSGIRITLGSDFFWLECNTIHRQPASLTAWFTTQHMMLQHQNLQRVLSTDDILIRSETTERAFHMNTHAHGTLVLSILLAIYRSFYWHSIHHSSRILYYCGPLNAS